MISKKLMKTISKSLSALFLALLLIGVTFIQSCNVTRKTTVESSYFSKGDTTIQITTKTIESYDARKNIAN